MILGARLGESQPESKPKLSVGSRGGSPTDGNLARGPMSPRCSRSTWPCRAVILKGELLIVSNRAEPSHTGLMYCTVHFSRNGMSHLFTALCKWLPFYLGATYAGQSPPTTTPLLQSKSIRICSPPVCTTLPHLHPPPPTPLLLVDLLF